MNCKFACKDIRIVAPNIGEGTYSHVGLCKIVKRGQPSSELYALKSVHLTVLKRAECPVYGKSGRVKLRTRAFQLHRELRILRLVSGLSANIVDLKFVKRSLDSVFVFTKYAGRPIMCFCDSLMAYSVRPSNLATLWPEDAVECLSQLSSALSFLHANGIVHKDVKPDNVLIRTPLSRWIHEGRSLGDAQQPIHITLCDFNISEIVENGRIFDAQGTTIFSPPECFFPISKKRGIDGFARDVWSLGILLWCLVCGTPPVIDSVPIRIQLALLSMETDLHLPPTLEIPPLLRAAIESCLRLDPKKRPKADFFSRKAPSVSL